MREHHLEYVLFGMALTDIEILKRVDPSWFNDNDLQVVLVEAQQRLADKSSSDLSDFTRVLKGTGCISWKHEGNIGSVSEALERIEDRVNVNSQYERAKNLACAIMRIPEWARGTSRDEVITTEEKLDIVSRVLEL